MIDRRAQEPDQGDWERCQEDELAFWWQDECAGKKSRQSSDSDRHAAFKRGHTENRKGVEGAVFLKQNRGALR